MARKPKQQHDLDRSEPIEAVADEFGVTASTVRGWSKDKCPCSKVDGRLVFNIAEVANWRRSRGMSTHNRNAGTSPDIDAARLRKENALADKYELHVARERGRLIEADDAKRTYANFVRVLRNRVMRIGASVALRWPGVEAARLQADIDKEAVEALKDVSESDEPDRETLAMAG